MKFIAEKYTNKSGSEDFVIEPNYDTWSDAFKETNASNAIWMRYLTYEDDNSIAISIDQARFAIKSLEEIVKYYDEWKKAKDEKVNRCQVGTRVIVNTKYFKDLEGEIYDVDKIDKERPLVVKIYRDKHNGFDSFNVYVSYDEIEIVNY